VCRELVCFLYALSHPSSAFLTSFTSFCLLFFFLCFFCSLVWVSSNGGAAWREVLRNSAAGSFTKRWGLGFAVNDAGVLMVLGGSSGVSFADLYVSYNGGVAWTKCPRIKGDAVIRSEQAVALSPDEKLIVGTGYRFEQNGDTLYRTELADMWISDQPFARTTDIVRLCGGAAPSAGVGLVVAGWNPAAVSSTGRSPTPDPEPETPVTTSSSSGYSTTTIVIIVVLVLAVVGVAYYLYKHHEKTGSWNPFDSSVAQPTSSVIDSTRLFSETDSSTQPNQYVQPGGNTQLAQF